MQVVPAKNSARFVFFGGDVDVVRAQRIVFLFPLVLLEILPLLHQLLLRFFDLASMHRKERRTKNVMSHSYLLIFYADSPSELLDIMLKV